MGVLGVTLYLHTIGLGIAVTPTQTSIPLTKATVTAPLATSTAIAQQVAAAMFQSAPELQPLIDRFDMRFIQVEVGDFLMGNSTDETREHERPPFTMFTDAYWIGLTEVTNAQYQHFINANGYNTRKWWTDAGWAWRTNITQPSFWKDTHWSDLNQPVVGVSWYEATAYVTWLSAETGLALRLPTEAEWEKAARGVGGRTYPWNNDDPTDQLLNYYKKVGRTTVVGSYPDGASPYGVLDMAGNVWEWTATQWVDNYNDYRDVVNNDSEGEVNRAVRGGAWNNVSNKSVRTTNRGQYPPADRYNHLGFRVVFAPGG